MPFRVSAQVPQTLPATLAFRGFWPQIRAGRLAADEPLANRVRAGRKQHSRGPDRVARPSATCFFERIAQSAVTWPASGSRSAKFRKAGFERQSIADRSMTDA